MSAEVLIYVFKVNIALALFYMLYAVIMRSDTHFVCRRIYLMFSAVAVFVLPFVPGIVSSDTSLSALPNFDPVNIITAHEAGTVGNPIDYYVIAAMLCAIVSFVLILKIIVGVAVLVIKRIKCDRSRVSGIKVALLGSEQLPYSFFWWIFIPDDDSDKQRIGDIINHEMAHARGWHSVDVLIAELLVALFWFNPAVWMLRKRMKENLEFLADRDVICCGRNRKEYQYSLLSLSHDGSEKNIINYFSQSQLKKRIIMMNKEERSILSGLKYLLFVPAFMLMSLINNAQDKPAKQAAEKISNETKPEEVQSFKGKSAVEAHSQLTKDDVVIVIKKYNEKDVQEINNPIYFVDDKEISKEEKEEMDKIKPESIESVTVLKDASVETYGEQGKNGVVLIKTKPKK